MQGSESTLNSLTHNEIIRISVILATYNRAQVLNKCLSSLSLQTLPVSLFEVLIGDDDSTDDTEEVVRSYLKTLQIYYSRAIKSNVCAVRNRVLVHARGDYILFINDDTIPSKNLLEMHYATHEEHHSEKICVMGKIELIEKNICTPFMYYSRFLTDDSNFGKIPFTYQDFRIAWTCNISVKRSALSRIGPFDEDFTLWGYDDIEYFYRLFMTGYRVYYNPLCSAKHDHFFTIISECSRNLQCGHNTILMCLKHRELLKLFTGCTSFQQLENEIIQYLLLCKGSILNTLYQLEKKADKHKEDHGFNAEVARAIAKQLQQVSHFFSNMGLLHGIDHLYHRRNFESSSLKITFISSKNFWNKSGAINALCSSMRQRNNSVSHISLDGEAEKINGKGVINLQFSDNSDRIPHADILMATDRKSAVFISMLRFTKGMKFFLIDPEEIDIDDKWKYAYLLPLKKIVQNADASHKIKERFSEECLILGDDLSGSDLEQKLIDTLIDEDRNRWNFSIPDLRIEKKDELSNIFDDSETAVRENDPSVLLNLLQDKERTLQSIYDSDGWKALSVYYRFKAKLFPYGSPRWHFMQKVFLCVKSLFGHKDRYSQWIRRNEPEMAALCRQRQAVFPSGPLLSIVTPVFNTPLGVFRDMLESVRRQTYRNWELCLSVGGDKNGTLRPLIERYMKKDCRIKAVFLNENKGIAGNTNEAISLATGDYVGFLDHDDIIAPFALYEVADVINERKDVDFIYSDEDLVDESGKKRSDPGFKPEFSPDFLRSNNYICHFLFCRKSLGDELGWLHCGYEGSQDYDFILRLAERSKTVAHIPKILYHWRKSRESVAQNPDSKPYAYESGKRALEDHLRRLDREAAVEQDSLKGYYHIHYTLVKRPLVSIIIPNSDQGEDLRRCALSVIERSTYRDFEIIITEYKSTKDATFKVYQMLEGTGYVTVDIWNTDFNFAAVGNRAAHQARGEVLLFLGNDTEVINPDWIERMLEHVQRTEVGAAGAKFSFTDRTKLHAGYIVDYINGPDILFYNTFSNVAGNKEQSRIVRNVSAVTGTCLMTRKELFLELGGFDEEFTLFCHDYDYCMRLREKGYLIVWTPHAHLYHKENTIKVVLDTPEMSTRCKRELERFYDKWGSIMKLGDPYFTPHLKIDRSGMQFRI